jgi:hypothetical protein
MGKHYVVYKYLDEFYQHAKSYALGLQKKYGIFCLNGILQFTIFMSMLFLNLNGSILVMKLEQYLLLIGIRSC